MKYCEKCGKQIGEEKFCPGCGNEIQTGHPLVTAAENDEATNNNCTISNEPKEKKKFDILKLPKKVLILAGVVIVAVVILIVSISNSGPNFKKIYKTHCSLLWAEVGSDGSYLCIDTNPDDEDDNGLAYYEAYKAIENVNKELNLPDSLFADMGKTTSGDGKQSEEFDDVIVSWKYHPDNGLEVTYKKK